MADNDSSTGGYLPPYDDPSPLEGLDLLKFVQEIVVGITGLPGPMVRPRFQSEPPNVPAAGTIWAAVTVSGERESDTFPYIAHAGFGEGTDVLQRHEKVPVLASFYDTGSGGQADKYAAILRDGLAIAQNREAMGVQGFALVEAGSPVALPSLLKDKWLYRVDIEFVLRRQIDRIYGVRNLDSAQGTIDSETVSVDFNAEE